MPIYRKNPDGTRTLVTYPGGSRVSVPVPGAATIPAPVPPTAAGLKPPSTAAVEPERKRRRGHAVKNEQGKFMPTSEGVGFASPPKEHQFKTGGPGGPGPKKWSVSFDTLIRKHLTTKRRVRIEGVDRKVSTAELILMTTIKDAAEGKSRDARKYVLAEMARAFPAQADSQAVGPREINDSDALSLAEYEAELRRQLLAEILAGKHDIEDAGEGDQP